MAKDLEKNLQAIDEIIEELENGDLPLDQAIKNYEKAMKLLKESSEVLKEAEGKILKVVEKNSGDIEIEEV